MQVFNEQSQILVKQLNTALKDKNDFDIYPFITRCTLDIICGTCFLIALVHHYTYRLVFVCIQIQQWDAISKLKETLIMSMLKLSMRKSV